MEWFRVYNDIACDWKLRELGDKACWKLILVMAYVNKNHRETGHVPYREFRECAESCHTLSPYLRGLFDKCIELQIMHEDKFGVHLTNWNKRQYKTDNVALRVQKYRKK